MKFQAFLVSANWDLELARLNILQREGLGCPEAT